MHEEPVLTMRFTCQANCMATPNFELYANGGDGNKIQFCTHVHQAVNFPVLVMCMLMLSNRDGGLRQCHKLGYHSASGDQL